MAFPPREAYERFIYSLPAAHPEMQSSTLYLYTNSPTTCFVRGSIWFQGGLELRVFEYLDFSDGELLGYHYAVFRGQERIRWYDPQPHPEISELASTFPHHCHEPPDIKNNRRPAPGISFQAPNLPALIADCIALGASPESPAQNDQEVPTMNRQEIVRALRTLEEERQRADLPDLRTLLDEEVYNRTQSFDERFLCACGGDHTQLWAWVELAQDELGVTFYLTEFTANSPFWYRLKTAWKVLRGRSLEFGLIFDPKDLPRLKALVNRLP